MLPMLRDQHIRALMADLIRAIEVSLAASAAARALVVELVRHRAEAGSFFQDDEVGPTLPLTRQDREFLSALSIRFDDR